MTLSVKNDDECGESLGGGGGGGGGDGMAVIVI